MNFIIVIYINLADKYTNFNKGFHLKHIKYKLSQHFHT